MGQNSVIAEFELKREDGTMIDGSEHSGNIDYIEDMGMMAPGIEKALKGLAEGADFSTDLQPEDMFGVKDDANILEVPAENFQGNVKDLEIGMIIEGSTPQGMKIMTVKAVEGDTVTLDANHPLAGLVLKFTGKIVKAQPATAEEIAAVEEKRQAAAAAAGGCGCGEDHDEGHSHDEGHTHGEGSCCGGKSAGDADSCRDGKKESGDSSTCCGGDDK